MNTDHIADYISPVIGWRAYKYVDLLASLNARMPFAPKVKLPAMCERLQNHPCPSKDCTCGYYAHKTRDKIIEEVNRRIGKGHYGSPWDPAGIGPETFAIGRVLLWGKVLEFEHGYRAEFCYPKTLLAQTPEDTKKLAALYECEEETCNWESLFASTESNPWENPYMLMHPMNYLYGNQNLPPWVSYKTSWSVSTPPEKPKVETI